MGNTLHYIIRAGAYVCAERDGKSFTKNRGKQLQSLKLRMEYGKRNGIFTRTRRNFFTFPLPETYGSATQNVRFEQRKHIVQRKKLYKRPSHLIKKLFDFSTKPKSFLFKDIIFLGKCVHQSEIFHLSMLFSKSNLQLDQTKMDDQQEVPMANRLKKSYKDFHYSYNN